jgi:hypothetical protein
MDERSARIARRFEVPILVAALLVVPVIAVEQSSLGEPWTTTAAVTNSRSFRTGCVGCATTLLKSRSSS